MACSDASSTEENHTGTVLPLTPAVVACGCHTSRTLKAVLVLWIIN